MLAGVAPTGAATRMLAARTGTRATIAAMRLVAVVSFAAVLVGCGFPGGGADEPPKPAGQIIGMHVEVKRSSDGAVFPRANWPQLTPGVNDAESWTTACRRYESAQSPAFCTAKLTVLFASTQRTEEIVVNTDCFEKLHVGDGWPAPHAECR